MLAYPQLLTVLSSIPSQTYTRNVFRSVELEALLSIPTPQPLYALGVRANGQRYTPKGGPPGLYVAENPSIAYIEANPMFASVMTLATQNAPPTVIFNLGVHLESILDMTIPTTQQLLGTNLAELTCHWQWQLAIGVTPPTHTLADAAYNGGRFQAIRYPSFTNNAEACIIVWTDRLLNPSFIQVNSSKRFAQRIP